MSQEELYDCIIVGGGPGGLTAGIYAMRAAAHVVERKKASAVCFEAVAQVSAGSALKGMDDCPWKREPEESH